MGVKKSGDYYRIQCDDRFCAKSGLPDLKQDTAEWLAQKVDGFVLQPDGTWLCARCNSEKQEKKEEA